MLGHPAIKAEAGGAPLDEREDVRAALFRLSPEAIALSTWDSAICRAVNPAFTRISGWSAEEAVGRAFSDGGMNIWVRQSDRERLREEAEGGDGTSSIEAVFRKKCGALFYGEVLAAKVRHRGEDCMLSMIRDESHARQAEARLRIADAQKGALSRELQHRVKNSLNVIASLLNLGASAADADRPLDVLASARMRVGSMALVYDLIDADSDLENVDMSSYIQRLCAAAVSGFPAEERRVGLDLDLDDVRLDAETAVRVGLLVNELVSNSLRHAFPDGRQGRIAVGVKRTKEACSLSVSDDGVGCAPEAASKGTIGMTLAEAMASQLGGSLEMETEAGVRATLAFPWPKRR